MFKKISGFDDDSRVMNIEDVTVDEFIKDNAKAPPKAAKKFAASEDRADEEGMTMAHEVVAHRVSKVCFSRGVKASDFESRIAIAEEVLKQDPALAIAYRDHAPVPTENAA